MQLRAFLISNLEANLPFYFSQEMPRSNFSVELDAANATWLSNDVAMLSTKTGELLLLTLVYDGRYSGLMSFFPFNKCLFVKWRVSVSC